MKIKPLNKQDINDLSNFKLSDHEISLLENHYELITLHQAAMRFDMCRFIYSTCLYGYRNKEMKGIIEDYDFVENKVQIYFPLSGEVKHVHPSSVFVRVYDDHSL